MLLSNGVKMIPRFKEKSLKLKMRFVCQFNKRQSRDDAYPAAHFGSWVRRVTIDLIDMLYL